MIVDPLLRRFGGRHTRRTERLVYGPRRCQRATLRHPHRRAEDGGPVPLVVLLHGGFWRWPFGRWLLWWVARDLPQYGWASLNVGYRRTGRLGGGGGWPMTFDDVVTAVDAGRSAMTGVSVDAGSVSMPVFVVGHSAGGHLALWLAAGGRVDIAGVISIGGLADLRAGLDEARWRSAVQSLVALVPHEHRFEWTSPAEMPPFCTRVALVHGVLDDVVPVDHVRRFAATARSTDHAVECHLVDHDGHRAALRPRSTTWSVARGTLRRWLDETPGQDRPSSDR